MRGLAPGAQYEPTGYSYYLRGNVEMVRRDNAFITGDAAGLATRDLGEGIGPAVRSGLRAARSIIEGDALPAARRHGHQHRQHRAQHVRPQRARRCARRRPGTRTRLTATEERHMAYVTVINEHAHVQQIVSGHHHLTADEPVTAGGSDAGFAARELLLASLGACTAVACRRHAAQRSWNVGKITVGVRWSRAADGREHIERRVSFARPLDAQQKSQLLQAAEESPIAGGAARRDQHPVGHRRLRQLT